MESDPRSRRDDDRVLDFLALFLGDREEGRERGLAEYLRIHPGIEAEVARHWLELRPPGPEADTEREPPAPAGDPGGRTLGSWRLVREIGRGGQGEVWLAEDTRLPRRAAVKLLRHGAALPEDVLARFRREAEITARLDHPGICAVYEAGREGGEAWIAMRLVDGETLAARIRGRPRSREEVQAAIAFVEEAARAVHAAHEAGVVHRDLKPGNIMVTDGGRPVILDFGLARDTSSAVGDLTRTGEVFGTPAYMAPEQISRDGGGADRRTDVWALGVTLFEAVTGRQPFAAPTRDALYRAILEDEPPSVRGDGSAAPAPRDLGLVLRTALAKDPARRYATALDLAEDLRRVRAREPVRARPPGLGYRFARWCGREPALAATALGLILALGTGLGVALRLRGAEIAERRRADDIARARDVSNLLAKAAELPGTDPSQAAGLRAWVDRARFILDAVPDSERRREELRARIGAGAAGDPVPAEGRGGDRGDAWLLALIEDLLVRAPELAALLPEMERRLEQAETIERRSVLDHAGAWERCAADVAASPVYGGLRLAPQLGLVPLRRDEGTGFWEFWVVESGARPEWSEDRERWLLRGDSGIVLILVPGGRSMMGCRPEEPGAEDDEHPARDVALDPYFLSRFETTRGQWLRAAGSLPRQMYESGASPGFDPGAPVDSGFPVENVSQEDGLRVAKLLGLELPTEAQWEHACRAGTTTAYATGEEPESLRGHANTGDGAAGAAVRPRAAGSLRPNPWGFHDLHGNVWEWCRDRHWYLDQADPRPGDGLLVPKDSAAVRDRGTLRGGSYRLASGQARSASRAGALCDRGGDEAGLRFSRSVRSP